MKGYIYKISGGGKVYYGSTIDFKKRQSRHMTNNKTSAKLIFQICENPVFEIVEEVEFDDRKDLEKREGWWIENNECVNVIVAGRESEESKKISRAKNKEKIREYKRQYREKNKERIREYQRQYNKKYYEEKKERMKEKNAVYYQENKERILERNKIWIDNNRDKWREYNRKYIANKRAEKRAEESVK